ncbi:MAG: hypothetical protein WBM61_17930 [Woeseiaceae bacterium]
MSESRRHASMVRRSVTLIREALRDNEEDFTTGPIRRTLALLTVLSVLVFRRGNWKQHAA